ncbi:hypothetical protein BC834DRAFT_309854 [Gloeopeniophorella convolvens]|nr:hypothetical protein BC834DRAFT_309854 [Gloeopeniophorella convolvens]
MRGVVPGARKAKRMKLAEGGASSDAGWFSTPPPVEDGIETEEGPAPESPRATTPEMTSIDISFDTPTVAKSAPAPPGDNWASGGARAVADTASPSASSGKSTPVASKAGAVLDALATPVHASRHTSSTSASTNSVKTTPINAPPPAPKTTPLGGTNLAASPSTAHPTVPVPSTSRRASPETNAIAGPSSVSAAAAPKGTSSRAKRRKEKKKGAGAGAGPKAETEAAEPPAPPQAASTVKAISIGDVYMGLYQQGDVQTTLDGGVAGSSAPVPGGVSAPVPAPAPAAAPPPERASTAQPAAERAQSAETSRDASPAQVADPPDDGNPLNMKAGLVIDRFMKYTPLAVVKPKAIVSVIAVVSSVTNEPKPSARGDWFNCLALLDPSTLDAHGGVLHADGAGMKANCFMSLKQWVPSPQQGDILILRSVQIQEWQGTTTISGGAQMMQWALYAPAAGAFTQPDPALTAASRAHNPPAWPLAPQERAYCVRLAAWWAAVQCARAERRGEAVQVGGGPVRVVPRAASVREHLLVCDADPTRPPGGYFNCTVEVLHGHTNQTSDIYSIYVTDYTAKRGTYTAHGSEWCPASLADRVLRIEMWRAKAAALGARMRPGEIWALDNVRMKVSREGYFEGSFSEADKARRVREDEADVNVHLRALLERKRQWEAHDASPHVFPHRLFCEVELQSVFDCTVEVLHASPNSTGTSTVYVTDYTARADLASAPPALAGRTCGPVLALELQGAQSALAGRMRAGEFFTVKHLRLLERVIGGRRVVGCVGGPDRLVHKLDAARPNEQLQALVRRKEEWETQNRNEEQEEDEKDADVEESGEGGELTTIARVLQSKECVPRFRVRASAVGTFPLRLRECIVRACKGCSEQVPAGADACAPCTEAPGWEHVFHLFVRLQDEHGGAQLTAAVDQNSTLLRGLTPAGVAAEADPAEVLRARLADWIGNLEGVQAASERGRTVQPRVPVREYTLESWYVPGEDEGEQVVAYGLA